MTPLIKAKALETVKETVKDDVKQATLLSLIDHSLKLSQEETEAFYRLIQKDSQFRELKMLQSIEEHYLEKGMDLGMEKGKEEGREKGREEGELKGRIETLKELHKQGILPDDLFRAQLPSLERKLQELRKKALDV